MSPANGHRRLRQRLPIHTVQLMPEPPTPWYEQEAFLVVGALTALMIALFGNLLVTAVALPVDVVYARSALHVAGLVLGITCLRGTGNTLRSAGSVSASNRRLLIAGMAAFAVIVGSALTLFSLLAVLDHLIE